MRLRKFIPPMSILLFLLLTLAGAYYVRRGMLERAMLSAMEIDDNATVQSLLNSWRLRPRAFTPTRLRATLRPP